MFQLNIRLKNGYTRTYKSMDRDVLLLHQDLILKLNPDAWTELKPI